MDADEWREALRACKGTAIRSEVFALDAPETGATSGQIRLQLTPFSVASHNCMIELLQPRGKNKHAVFIVKESEAITYSYERNPADPRVAHQLNIKVDEYGNILESASVVYPRVNPDLALPAETRAEQDKTLIIYTENRYTNDVFNQDVHRQRLISEVRTYELKGVDKADTFYLPGDFKDILTKAIEAGYQEIDKVPAPGTTQKRVIEHTRTIFYKNDLSANLPLLHLDSLAIPYENYQLAYTPELLTDIFGPVNLPGSKVNDSVMETGKYCHCVDENNLEDTKWWIRSGTTQYLGVGETLPDAQNRFFVPVSYTDPYGAVTKVKYLGNSYLFINETEDHLGNKTTVDLFNYRTLSPQRMKDANLNLSETLTDELGLVKAMAVFGKGDEADDLSGLTESTSIAEQAAIDDFFSTPLSTDLVIKGNNLLQHATSRYIYNFDLYQTTGRPSVTASIVREEHFKVNNNADISLGFEYSNGSGKVIMKKLQAEPGLAKSVTVNPDESIVITEVDTSKLVVPQLRWIGNGRTVLNNKGNAVKQYEPFFSVTNQFEDVKEVVENGVTPVMYYDAMSRLMRTVKPDGTFTKVAFDSWKQSSYDPNDTVLDSEWYKRRSDPARVDYIIDPLEHSSAAKTAIHSGTPTTIHFDPLGRAVLSVEHCKNAISGSDDLFYTKVKIDIEGNMREVTDGRQNPSNANQGNTVILFKYDMLGKMVYQNSMDSGQKWMLPGILGNPHRKWDERNHEIQYYYDLLHRPSYSVVIHGDRKVALNHIFERIFYGENEITPELKNLRGQVIKHYDTAGVVETPEYDLHGKPVKTTRKLFKKYREVANWTDLNLIPDLEPDEFTFITETDAIGRIKMQTAPDLSVITPSYNKTGLLKSESVHHINPNLTKPTLKLIDYNEKGKRVKVLYGNDILSAFTYDKETFRLVHLKTTKQNGDQLQDLTYTYDPIGNITHIEDLNVPVKFFNNQKITGESGYTYDSLYRLAEASGRENSAALNFGECDNWNDLPFMHSMNPGDPMAARNYIQRYKYDPAGNITEMKHLAVGGNWTRTYEYEGLNNRLKNTHIGDNGSPVDFTSYTYHPFGGYLTSLPHLETIGWNFKEEVMLTIRQHCTGDNVPVTTYYQYDGSGQRIRKVTENAAQAGQESVRKEERIYMAGYETYRRYKANNIELERETLSLIDGGHRFVMVDTVKQNHEQNPDPSDLPGTRLIRYQLHNHIGSSSLELDDGAEVISYEEYHPFGTTAYQPSMQPLNQPRKDTVIPEWSG
ncbi:MAG: toxin TcdB middle/C-terminal domain-containing protein, partial [Bacteroidota bacterium]